MKNKLSPFRWYVLNNFPFIEQDFDALTNYELMCKIIEYVNKIAEKENVLGQEVENLINWFNNLDVQDEIDNKLDEMAEDGTLAEIINPYLNKSLTVMSIKEEIINSPLLMIKKLIGGTTGDAAAFQSVAVKYNSSGVPQEIYVLCNYNSEEYTRLYVATCGSRIDGSGWSYRYTDNVPQVHGSSMCYKDGFLYIAELGVDTIGKYDIANDTYTTIDVSSLFTSDPQFICGVGYDPVSDTFLISGDDNSKLFVVNNDFTQVIRSYTHNFNATNEYVEQDFDYYNGIEIRCCSFNYNNVILFIDTASGKILKSTIVKNVTGEIESCSFRKGYLTILWNSFNPALDEISFGCVSEAYVGGYEGNDYLIMTQLRPLISNDMIFGNYPFQWRDTYYLENNYANTSIVRYAGIGTESNPFKSSLAMLSSIIAISDMISDYKVTINVKASTNTDDTYIRMVSDANLVQLQINGDSNTLNGEISIDNFNGCLILNGVTTQEGVSRRSNSGQIYLYQCSNAIFQGTNVADLVNLQANQLRMTGTLSTDGSTFAINRNILLQGGQTSFTGDNLIFSHNIVAS